MNSRILYTKPSITDLEVQYASDAARNGWGENCYDYIVKFENLFKDHLGVDFAIATSSCTGALHMGLAGLNIGPGDEVILADTNWIATAAPIVHLGATPVFVDILEDTWCIDPKKVEVAVTSKTKAIIATHLYGNLSDMNHLLEIGEKNGVPIIEDAAEAIGSSYQDRCAGSMGKFGTFSFHGSKTITTGEGGMFVTNDSNLFEKVLTLSNYGRSRDKIKQFTPDILGFKYKLSNIQAAIGCAQIERINELLARKREIFSYYNERLTAVSGIKMNPEYSSTINGYWMPTVVFDESLDINCEVILKKFKEKNIDGRAFFSPLSSLSMFSAKKQNFNSWSVPKRSINLPSYHDISTDEMDRVIEVLLSLILKATG
jgi:perosamine synthetase